MPSALTGNTSGLASATSPGLVGITTQTFAGDKTLTGLITASGGIINSGLIDANATAVNTAGSGKVGEYKTLTLASPLSITANTLQNVISTFTLDKGIWLVWGRVSFSFSAISFSGTYNVFNISISATSATTDVDSLIQTYLGGNMTSGTSYSVTTSPKVLNIASNATPVYLVSQTLVASITGSYSNQCNIKALRIA
jgi:hypothetical protein